MPLLELAWPSDGWYSERITAAEGAACLIGAFIQERPVAHLDLRSEPYYAVVRDTFPTCFEINAMLVHDGLNRSRGIGSRLIQFAESLCASAAVAQLGLAVALDNGRAATLYARLGFEPAGSPFHPYGGTEPTHQYLTKAMPVGS